MNPSPTATIAFLPGRSNTPASAKQPSGQDGPQRQAWQREMERAQMASWFRGSAAAPAAQAQSTHSPPAGGRGFRATAAQADGGPRECPVAASACGALKTRPAPAGLSNPPHLAPLARSSTPGRARGPATQTGGQSGEAPLSTTSTGIPPAPTRQQPHRQSVEQDATATAQSARASNSESEPAPTPVVRVHSERCTQGLSVWIAWRADNARLESALPQLVADLRRDLAGRGQRLSQLVCNGRVIWQDESRDGGTFFDSPNYQEP